MNIPRHDAGKLNDPYRPAWERFALLTKFDNWPCPSWISLLLLLTLVLLPGLLQAADYRLKQVDLNQVGDGGIEVRFQFSDAGSPPQPRSFAITNPYRVAVDFSDTDKAPEQTRKITGSGVIDTIQLAQAQNRLRATLKLKAEIPHRLVRQENAVVLFLEPRPADEQSTSSTMPANASETAMIESTAADTRAADAAAARHVLQQLQFAELPGDKVQLLLRFAEASPTPSIFALNNPARLSVDLPGTVNQSQVRSKRVDISSVRDIGIAESANRTRLVVNLSEEMGYETTTDANAIRITLSPLARSKAARTEVEQAMAVGEPSAKEAEPAAAEVENIDFRRGENGGGRLIVKLSEAQTPVDVSRRPTGLRVDLYHTDMPDKLIRRLDVTDFATPVETIDAYRRGDGTRIEVNTQDEFDHMVYQTNRLLTVEINEPPERPTGAKGEAAFPYEGERLSLNFQDIEVRSVLQLIADFTGFNVVVSDSVSGSVTLRLQDVPWDQALDIVLKTKGLGMRMEGNVMLVAPLEEIAERERKEAEAREQQQELAPLYTEFIKINYARADDLVSLIEARRGRGGTNRDGGGGNQDQGYLLSQRGSISVDQRTNIIMVRDTAENLELIRNLIEELDHPVRQVLIEARIVFADTTFSRSLGVRSGLTTVQSMNDERGLFALSGSAEATDSIVSEGANNINSTGLALPVSLPTLTNRLNNDFAQPGSRIGMSILGSDFLVDLELSALQAEGRGEVISSPRIVTMDQQQASIEQGQKIPFETVSQAGTQTQLEDAVLKLDVTPSITPDGRISMELDISNDSPGEATPEGLAINTQSIITSVMVENGDTLVLGGVQQSRKDFNERKVPLLGDLPLLGWLFRSKQNVDEKSELLIFITPKIINENLISSDAS